MDLSPKTAMHSIKSFQFEDGYSKVDILKKAKINVANGKYDDFQNAMIISSIIELNSVFFSD